MLNKEGLKFYLAMRNILLVAKIDSIEHHSEIVVELDLIVGAALVLKVLEKGLFAKSTMVNKLTKLKYNNNPCFYIFRIFSKHFCDSSFSGSPLHYRTTKETRSMIYRSFLPTLTLIRHFSHKPSELYHKYLFLSPHPSLLYTHHLYHHF